MKQKKHILFLIFSLISSMKFVGIAIITISTLLRDNSRSFVNIIFFVFIIACFNENGYLNDEFLIFIYMLQFDISFNFINLPDNLFVNEILT